MQCRGGVKIAPTLFGVSGMTPLTKWTVVAVCLTVLAVLVPWARYGDIDVELSRLPWWWVYPGAAVVLHGLALVRVPFRFAVVVACAVVVAAVFVASGYGDASAVFGDVVPAVFARFGYGVVFAVAAVAAQVVGLRADRAVPVG